MAALLLITFGTSELPEVLPAQENRDRLDAVDVYEVPDVPLADYRGVLVPMHVDQRFLATHAMTLQAYLRHGGRMVLCGHLGYPVLPGARLFVPLEGARLQDYRVHRLNPHPVFEGVDPEDMTYRRGVAGFYGRGHNPPPPGAVPLNGLGPHPHAHPVDWVRGYPNGGALLMHAGNDLWTLPVEADTTQRLVPQLLDWLEYADG